LSQDSNENTSDTNPSPNSAPLTGQGSEPIPPVEEKLTVEQETQFLQSQLSQAKTTYNLFINFRDAVRLAQFPGKCAGTIAQGLNFLENMMNQGMAHQDQIKHRLAELKKQPLEMRVIDEKTKVNGHA
jgi:hypothetical protein